MAARVVLRALLHRYTDPSCRAGPFLLQLTDLHASNIFVDGDWNVVCLIDLEWVCALPAAMLDVPYWLTGRGIDQITGEHLVEFDKVRREFMHIFEQEEHEAGDDGHSILSQVMHSTWDSGGVWFWHSIASVNATFGLVNKHLCAKFSTDLYLPEAIGVLSKFWCDDAEAVIDKKVAEYHEYEVQLKSLFAKENRSTNEQARSENTN